MALLRRRVSYQVGESATSYASRLAACNGTALNAFCTHMGISRSGIANGSDEALNALGSLSGVDVSVLQRETTRRVGESMWRIRDQTLNVPTIRRGPSWFCPLCARDDLAAGTGPESQRSYGRAAWSVEPLRTCQIHNVAYVEFAPGLGRGTFHDYATTFASALAQLDENAASLNARRPSGLEKYLHRRLMGTGGVAWLDDLSFHVVAIMVERVGAVACLGRRFDAGALSSDDWWQAGSVGFDLLQGGPNGLTEFLADLRSSYQFGLSGLAGPRALYGKLWQWLEKGCSAPEFDPVRDIVRNHVLGTIPIASGTEVLGQVLERRKLHSIRSASLDYGRHPKRLRALLVAHGIITKDTASDLDAHVTFSADAAETFLNGVSTAMSASEVKKLLNVRHIEPYVQGGVLTPIAAILGKKDGRLEFMRSDVEQFLRSLTINAKAVPQKETGMAGIYEASKKARCTIATIFNLIASGKLTWVGRVEGAFGLESILVDPEETRRMLTTVDVEHVAEYQIIKRLGVDRVAVRALIEHGILGNIKPITPGAKNQKRAVRLAAVEAFERTYVSLFKLAKERGQHARTVKKALAENSIFPALQPDIYSTSFYLRSAV